MKHRNMIVRRKADRVDDEVLRADAAEVGEIEGVRRQAANGALKCEQLDRRVVAF